MSEFKINVKKSKNITFINKSLKVVIIVNYSYVNQL